MKTLKIGVSLVALAVISACSDSTNYDFEGSRQDAEDAAAELPATTFEASFSPASSIFPFPNNILMSGSVDGTINIPVDDAEDYSNPQVALNALDGFSTTAPISTGFSQAIDPETIKLGETVRIFEVTADPATGAVTGIVAELTQAQIAATVVGEDADTLALIPIVPLSESTTYLVVLTNGIQNTAEPAAIANKSVSYYLTSGDDELTGPTAVLEPLRQLTGSFEAVASAAAGIAEDRIVLSWSFTTQSVTPVLQSLADVATAGNIVVSPSGVPSSAFGVQLTGASNIHFGSVTVPYYQIAPTAENPAAGINGFFKTEAGGFVTRFSPLPAKTGDQTIPLILTVPAGEVPTAGWPIVIFQHGITQDRSNVLALADSMASAGLALVAIDLPMHGITDPQSPLYAEAGDLQALGGKERTFGLDLANNETGVAGPDGVPDSSGTHFYNLQNLLNARDNLRQAVSDLLTLESSLASIQGISLNTSSIGYVGHSLGGIIGTTYLAYSNDVGPATLAMPGVGLSRLLANSASFGPVINAGLADQGAPQGSVAYETFLTAAQTVIDSGDPVNFAATAASLHPVHLMEVVGGSAGSLPDQVIPNQVATAPLSGTEPMARLMGLDPVTATVGNGSSDVSGLVRFIAGDHGSILNPAADVNTTVEMQTQTANFMASGGKLLKITDTSVISTGE